MTALFIEEYAELGRDSEESLIGAPGRLITSQIETVTSSSTQSSAFSGKTEHVIVTADAEISARCGWPNDLTVNWCSPRELEDGSFVIEYPENGYEQFTKEHMLGDSSYNVIENPVFKVDGDVE